MKHPATLLPAALVVLLGGALAPPLGAQSMQFRAKVADTIPKYAPKVRVRGVLEVPGTDSLSDLGDEWNRSFRQFHPEGRLIYLPKLSKEAIKDLNDGVRAVIVSAREMTSEEMQAFRTKFGYMPMRIPVCLDANIVFVNKTNPITSITMEQLDAIYGKDRKGGLKEPLQTWGDLGVRGDLAKRPINAYAREEGSAIRATFAAATLLGGDFRPGIAARGDSSSLAESILTDQAGIAFGPMASWYTTNKILPVVPYQGSDARLPTQEMVTTSRYPMPMLYYAYVNRPPGQALDPAVDEFLHFVLSQEGQNTVADVGLFPGPTEFLTIAIKRLDR
ncbi:MAG: substrate-binding domain-containing protein [Acidobacteria bacterium]|nr:substrate-binding domain-containing protein [Acidobacteriota bacterium]